jgi:hypothetical protein
MRAHGRAKKMAAVEPRSSLAGAPALVNKFTIKSCRLFLSPSSSSIKVLSKPGGDADSGRRSQFSENVRDASEQESFFSVLTWINTRLGAS